MTSLEIFGLLCRVKILPSNPDSPLSLPIPFSSNCIPLFSQRKSFIFCLLSHPPDSVCRLHSECSLSLQGLSSPPTGTTSKSWATTRPQPATLICLLQGWSGTHQDTARKCLLSDQNIQMFCFSLGMQSQSWPICHSCLLNLCFPDLTSVTFFPHQLESRSFGAAPHPRRT